MIYLEIRERLGNQLFQYAFARYMMIKYNDKLTINFEAIINRNDEEHGWKNQLVHFNVCDYNITTQKKYSTIQKLILHLLMLYTKDDNYIVINKKQRKLCWILNKFGIYCLNDGFLDFYDSFKFINDKIIMGYFESPKYFIKIDDIIKKEISSKFPMLNHNKKMYELINITNSVCVTIRRGDFLHPMYKDEVYICDEQYFYRGIEEIKKLVPNTVLFIFSDEINWVRKNMTFDGEVYYETGNDPVWEKMRLMSACKHFIISNSSFSWWVQYLSSNANKIVIAPKIWRNDGRLVALYQDNWITIEA